MLMPVRKPNFEFKPGKNEPGRLFDFTRFSTKVCSTCDTKRITACPECMKRKKS